MPRNALTPPDPLGPTWADLTADPSHPLWSSDNPVGTDRLRDYSLGNQGQPIDPVVGSVNGAPITASRWGQYREAAANVLNFSTGGLSTVSKLGLDAAATKVLRDMMPETLQSRSFYSIKPPEMPPRPFADDYKGEVLSDGSGTLTHTVDGQPITARHVVGRRTAGKPDTAITPEGVDDISENVLGAVPQAVAKREMGGDAGRYIHGVDPLTCSRP